MTEYHIQVSSEASGENNRERKTEMPHDYEPWRKCKQMLLQCCNLEGIDTHTKVRPGPLHHHTAVLSAMTTTLSFQQPGHF